MLGVKEKLDDKLFIELFVVQLTSYCTRKFKVQIRLALRARPIFPLNLLVKYIVYCTPNRPITATYHQL